MPESVFIAPNILTPSGEHRMPIRFGVPSDVDRLRVWRVGRSHGNPAAAKDSIEYAKLASKRWRYYSRRDEVARSLTELESRCKDTKSEVGFLLVADSNTTTGPDTLAMAWCRRTWSHHLVLDFLACHPFTFDRGSGYGGVGTAMLFALGLISAKLGIPLIWGEATELSAGFYSRRVLGGEIVTDHFFIRNEHLAALQRNGMSVSVQT